MRSEKEKRNRVNLTSALPTTNTVHGPSIHNCYSTLRERSGKKDCEVSRVHGRTVTCLWVCVLGVYLKRETGKGAAEKMCEGIA